MRILGILMFALRGSRCWWRAAGAVRGRVPLLALLLALALATPANAETKATAAAACTDLTPGPTRTVARVIDAETVALDDGSELRLTGALPPRAMDADAEAGAWPMETAAIAALRTLVLGKSVELRFGAGARKDRYGRHEAQAFLIEGDGRRWVQGALLEQGLARAYAPATGKGGARSVCLASLLAAEQPAREARRGLWAEAAYQVRAADKPGELTRYIASFQVVEGQIVRIGQTRGTVYLNFAFDWRRGFSVSLRRSDLEAVLGSAHAGNPKGLEGRIVRVRGWIVRRGGAPVINLSAGGAIEILDKAADK